MELRKLDENLLKRSPLDGEFLNQLSTEPFCKTVKDKRQLVVVSLANVAKFEHNLNMGGSRVVVVVDLPSFWEQSTEPCLNVEKLSFVVLCFLNDSNFIALAILRSQVVWTSIYDRSSFDQDGDLVTQLFYLIHTMGSHHDGGRL